MHINLEVDDKIEKLIKYIPEEYLNEVLCDLIYEGINKAVHETNGVQCASSIDMLQQLQHLLSNQPLERPELVKSTEPVEKEIGTQEKETVIPSILKVNNDDEEFNEDDFLSLLK